MKAAFRRKAPGPDRHQARQQEPVYGITTADEPLSADIARRQKQYLISMVFRLVAIGVVIWVPGISWQIKAVLGIVATVIPFFAVVSANGAPAPDHQSTNLVIAPPAAPAIEGRDSAIGPGEEFLTGESVHRDAPAEDGAWKRSTDGANDRAARTGSDSPAA